MKSPKMGKHFIPFLWFPVLQQVSQFKACKQVKIKRNPHKKEKTLNSRRVVQKCLVSVAVFCWLVKPSSREVLGSWTCSSGSSRPEKTLSLVIDKFLCWPVEFSVCVPRSSVNHLHSEQKMFCLSFKWQEGDSELLIGGSEVFSEVQRNSRRLKIQPSNSELIAEGGIEAERGRRRVIWTFIQALDLRAHWYCFNRRRYRVVVLHNLLICCGSVFTVLSKQM